jgi:glycosyltransferase involved in cell wall biosynthesis
MASGVRTLELAKSLNKLGVETIVFSPYEESRTTKDGIRVVKVPTFFSTLHIDSLIYSASRRFYYSHALQRLVIKSSKCLLGGQFQLSSGLADFFKKFNLDIIQAEQDNAALTLLPIRSKLGIPLVLDLHGIWPEELLSAAAISEDSKDWNELQATMNHIVENVDLTVCLSDAMKEYVLSHYNNNSRKVAVVPPGGRVFCKERSERPLPWKITYAGIVSYRKHVDLFVRSMPHVKKEIQNVEFGITKKGDLLKQIQSMANSLGVQPNYFWYSNLEKTLEYLSSCHIGVLPTTNDESSRISMPSKLFDYMSVGLPIIANDVGGWTDIIKKNNLGRISKDDPVDFANCMLDLLYSPEELVKCGSNGIDMIKNTYNWSKSAETLMGYYKAL